MHSYLGKIHSRKPFHFAPKLFNSNLEHYIALYKHKHLNCQYMHFIIQSLIISPRSRSNTTTQFKTSTIHHLKPQRILLHSLLEPIRERPM